MSTTRPLRSRTLLGARTSLAIALGAALCLAGARDSSAATLDVGALEHTHSLPTGSLVSSVVLPSPYGEVQRFVQRHGGVPVHGAGLAVRVDGGAVRVQTEALVHGLRVDTTPTLSADMARAKASAFGGHPIVAQAPTRLLVVPQADVGGYLVWQVDAFHTTRGPQRIWVDAHDGTILAAHSLVMHAKGRVFATDPGNPPVDRDLVQLTSTTTLDGRAAAIGNFTSGDIEQGQTLVFDATAKPDADGDYLFDPETKFDLTDAFAQVNAYYHIDRMDSFFRSSLGVPMGYGLQVVVNYAPGGSPYDNAFFTPYDTARFHNLIVIGEGSSIDFAYDSDVFMHEFTHYVNANTVTFNDGSYGDQYGLNPMPGALDEGTADYFACTVNDDPILGGAALAALGGQRDLTRNPGRCPDVLVGEPHEDGGLVGNATWRIREAVGRDAADPLIWSAIQLLHGGATFADFANGITKGTDAAVANGTMTAAKAAEVKAILDDLGLPGCGRAIEVTKAKSATSGFVGLSLLGQYFGGYTCAQLESQVAMTSLFQYEFVAGPNDKLAKLTLSLAPRAGRGGNDKLDYSLYVRKGNLVTFTGGLGGYQAYKAKSFDFKVEHLATETGSITLGAGGDGNLEPGATYYLAVLHTNCPTMEGTVSVQSTDVVPDTDAGVEPIDAAPDAGADTGESLSPGATLAGGGCACTTTPRDRGVERAGAFAAIAAIALASRRRRRA